ncbi:MAG: FHA domain-containing protein [Deltaproteobacteria bacterium]|nr:FHA domain-containing protein [Deltaproteobacteria bacterium]
MLVTSGPPMEAAGPTYQIAIVDDEGQVTSVPLMRDEFTVGRKEGNVIRLTERNVSRNHARILRENGRFYLNDLGSYNGTRLNGRRIRGKMPLSPGDEIGIGDYTLKIEALAATADDTPSGPPPEPVQAPQIAVVIDGSSVAVHVLSDVPHVIGRGDEATIRIDDVNVSRTHARLHLLQGRYFVEDAGSASGIKVGERRVLSKALDPGDIIDIGRARLYFTLGALRPEDIKPRTVTAPPKPASRLPMVFGILGAVVAVAGVIYLLVGRNKGGAPAAVDETSVAAADAGRYGGPGAPDVPEVALAVVPRGADAGAEAPALPPATADAAAQVEGPSPAERLAEARAAAEKAAATAEWDAVLDLLAAAELASDPDAVELRAAATRERDARRALDDAATALAAGDAAGAASKLAAVPPDARCARDAAGVWDDVLAVGREAVRAAKVDELRLVVEALNAVLAPPRRVAAGREELATALRRLEAHVPGVADAGTPPPPADVGAVRPRDAGTTPATDARVREEATATPRDAGATEEAAQPTGNAAEEALAQARQLILSGDNAGCINVLTHAPQTCRNIEVLVTCYKSEARMPDAYTAMENYLRRCEGQRKYEEYQQILQGAGRAP